METSNPNMETLYYRLIEDYKNTLLYPVNVYYKNSIKELVHKNNTLQDSVQQGFYLNGSFYTSEDYPTKKYLFNPLHESLTEEFLSLKSFVEFTIPPPFVVVYYTLILLNCQIRDILLYLI